MIASDGANLAVSEAIRPVARERDLKPRREAQTRHGDDRRQRQMLKAPRTGKAPLTLPPALRMASQTFTVRCSRNQLRAAVDVTWKPGPV